jgi:hypothetical protein
MAAITFYEPSSLYFGHLLLRRTLVLKKFGEHIFAETFAIKRINKLVNKSYF